MAGDMPTGGPGHYLCHSLALLLISSRSLLGRRRGPSGWCCSNHQPQIQISRLAKFLHRHSGLLAPRCQLEAEPEATHPNGGHLDP